MFKQFITTLDGNEIYMLGSLFIFFAFFIIATIALIRMKKKHTDYMSSLPFETENRDIN